eukprot:CAMPEP_0177649998 /NCGR_PEP_ID=MMETSP0447-20121125/11695_1 /TAXON_ID=0 /ORGANISM="Stygamoeba regulata, Strain BSH-02190019" /LENGTH=1001 /DNA_ID=CAMNT_0019152813 /DNA_START=273 /DNA_END=3278 /DNA_ORIENTATION=-
MDSFTFRTGSPQFSNMSTPTRAFSALSLDASSHRPLGQRSADAPMVAGHRRAHRLLEQPNDHSTPSTGSYRIPSALSSSSSSPSSSSSSSSSSSPSHSMATGTRHRADFIPLPPGLEVRSPSGSAMDTSRSPPNHPDRRLNKSLSAPSVEQARAPRECVSNSASDLMSLSAREQNVTSRPPGLDGVLASPLSLIAHAGESRRRPSGSENSDQAHCLRGPAPNAEHSPQRGDPTATTISVRCRRSLLAPQDSPRAQRRRRASIASTLSADRPSSSSFSGQDLSGSSAYGSRTSSRSSSSSSSFGAGHRLSWSESDESSGSSSACSSRSHSFLSSSHPMWEPESESGHIGRLASAPSDQESAAEPDTSFDAPVAEENRTGSARKSRRRPSLRHSTANTPSSQMATTWHAIAEHMPTNLGGSSAEPWAASSRNPSDPLVTHLQPRNQPEQGARHPAAHRHLQAEQPSLTAQVAAKQPCADAPNILLSPMASSSMPNLHAALDLFSSPSSSPQLPRGPRAQCSRRLDTLLPLDASTPSRLSPMNSPTPARHRRPLLSRKSASLSDMSGAGSPPPSPFYSAAARAAVHSRSLKPSEPWPSSSAGSLVPSSSSPTLHSVSEPSADHDRRHASNRSSARSSKASTRARRTASPNRPHVVADPAAVTSSASCSSISFGASAWLLSADAQLSSVPARGVAHASDIRPIQLSREDMPAELHDLAEVGSPGSGTFDTVLLPSIQVSESHSSSRSSCGSLSSADSAALGSCSSFLNVQSSFTVLPSSSSSSFSSSISTLSGDTANHGGSSFLFGSSPLHLSRSTGSLPMTLMPDSELDVELILPFEKACPSPLISVHTMKALLEGEFANALDSFAVIDCRYPYEFEGGHIKGAVNVWRADHLRQRFLETTARQGRKQTAFIFHCEFSSERAPRLCKLLREWDRNLNALNYPQLYYPQLYVLKDGYKEFHRHFPMWCTPSLYRPMNAAEFRQQKKSYHIELRKSLKLAVRSRRR